MSATSSVAVRLVLKRLASDPLVTATSLLTIVTAAVLLAAGPIYASGVAERALQESLRSSPPAKRSIEIRQQLPVDAIGATAGLVEAEIDRSLQGSRFVSTTRLESESYAVETAGAAEGASLLASFEHLAELDRHATLVAGDWPVAGADPLQVVLTDAASSALARPVGALVSLVDRTHESRQVTVEVSGVITIDEPGAALWSRDELVVDGFRPSDAFPRAGPWFVTEEDFFARLVPRRVTATWHVDPDPTGISVSGTDVIERRVARLETTLNKAFDERLRPGHGDAAPIVVDTGLHRLLAEVSSSLTVTDATVYALLLQLSILSGYALALTAGLIVETRSSETHLVRSRGATPRTLFGLAWIEGLVLVTPAVAAAPWLASSLLSLLDRTGIIRSGPLTPDRSAIITAYLLAAAAGLAALAALTVPALRAARRSEGAQGQGREAARTATQRSGLDLAFLTLLVIGIWQLDTLGDDLAARVQGRFDVDPLLVVVPALGLVAGGVASLRLVPLAARIAERILRRSRSAVPALSAWQIARRPRRYATTSLLLVMAVTVAFFATSFSSTWSGSQADQATFEISSDARVLPDQRTNVALTPMHLVTGYEQVEGVTAAMPVLRTSRIFRDGPAVEIVALDAARAGEVVDVRPDLAPGFEQLAERLRSVRPTGDAIELPGPPEQLSVVVSATQQPLPVPDEPEAPPLEASPEPDPTPAPSPEAAVTPQPPPDARVALRAVIRDGDGLLHRIDLGPVPMDVDEQRLAASLLDGEAGSPLRPAAPIELVSLEIEVLFAAALERSFDLRFHTVSASDGAEVAIPDADLTFSTSVAGFVATQPSIERLDADTDGRLGLRFATGTGRGAFVTEVRVRRSDAGETALGAIVTESFLDESGLSVGHRFRWNELDADAGRVEIVGSVSALPTIEGDGAPAVMLDLPALQLVALDPFSAIEHGDQYWLALDGRPDAVVDRLLAAPFDAVEVLPRATLEDDLLNDPVALGAIGALELGILASAAFAAIGFAVSSAVSSRERLREFATLRALGLSPGELGRWLSAEYAALVLVSLGFGTILGFVLARVLLPLISLTREGDLIYPTVLVEHPWSTIALVDAAIVSTTLATTALVIGGLRRSGLGHHLRMGDE